MIDPRICLAKIAFAFISGVIILSSYDCVAQGTNVTVSGVVLDARTREPLSNATVEVKSRGLSIIVFTDGKFKFDVPAASVNDSVEVSYVGYKTYKARIGDLRNPTEVLLQDYSIELRTVTITSRNLKMKDIDKALRPVRGNLYAYENETTNGLYNLFLGSLEENGQDKLLHQCAPDLSRYSEEDKQFYTTYAAVYKAPENKKDTTEKDYTRFPVVNISHDAAVILHCRSGRSRHLAIPNFNRGT
jgi:hypothetical protein